MPVEMVVSHGHVVGDFSESWIDEEDLRGRGRDKLEAIRSYAQFFAGNDPA